MEDWLALLIGFVLGGLTSLPWISSCSRLVTALAQRDLPPPQTGYLPFVFKDDKVEAEIERAAKELEDERLVRAKEDGSLDFYQKPSEYAESLSVGKVRDQIDGLGRA